VTLSPPQQETILRYLGIAYQDKGDHYLCRSPLRADHNPDFVVYKDRAFCVDYAGTYRGSLLRLFYKITGKLVKNAIPSLDFAEDESEVSWGFSSPREKEEKKEERRHGVVIEEASIVSVYDDADAYRYCLSRGVDEETIESWQVRYARRCRMHGVVDPKPGTPGTLFSHRILIPIVDAGETWSVEGRIIRRDVDKKTVRKVLYPRGCSVDTLFGIDHLKRDEPLVVVEGLMDLVRVRKVHPNSTCTFGIQIAPNQARMLNDFSKVILMPDSDKGGDAFITLVADLLERELAVARVPEKDPGDSTPEHIKKALDEARPLSDLMVERSGIFQNEDDNLRW
jgi:DNA primase